MLNILLDCSALTAYETLLTSTSRQIREHLLVQPHLKFVSSSFKKCGPTMQENHTALVSSVSRY